MPGLLKWVLSRSYPPLTWLGGHALLLVALSASYALADDWMELFARGNYNAFLDDALRTPDFNGLASSVFSAYAAAIYSNWLRQMGVLSPPPAPPTPWTDPYPWTLPPDQDPNRLTTYADYEQWANTLIREAWRDGRVDRLDPLLQARLQGFLASGFGPPDTWPDSFFTDSSWGDMRTKVESGSTAALSVIRAYSGVPNPPIVVVPNPPGAVPPSRIYIRPPATAADWPPGIRAGCYETTVVQTPGGPVEVIDPDSFAIVKEVHPPQTDPKFGTTDADLRNAGIPALPGTTPPVYPAPENVPDNVSGIGYAKKKWTDPRTGKVIDIIDTGKAFFVQYW